MANKCFAKVVPFMWKNLPNTQRNVVVYLTNVRELSSKEDGEVSNEFGSKAKAAGLNVFTVPKFDTFSYKEENYFKPRADISPVWYHKRCKTLIKKGEILESAKLLEQMLFEDRVPPEEYNFSIVIGSLGRIGNVALAFKLFGKLKDYGLKPSVAVYTSLFNAISNCKSKNYSQKAEKLYESLKKNNVRLNRINYHSIMNAFAKTSMFDQVLLVFRDALAAGIEPDQQTFQILLVSCLQNKDQGFLHAIQVWKQMTLLGVKPNAFNFTALLKVVRNCQLGNIEIANKLLFNTTKNEDSNPQKYFIQYYRSFQFLQGQTSKPRSKLDENNHKEIKHAILTALDSHSTSLDSEDTDEVFKDQFAENFLPNVTDDSPTEFEIARSKINLLNPNIDKTSTSIVAIKECPSTHQRLDLIGGPDIILQSMKDAGVKPNIKHLTALISVCNSEDENKLLDLADKLRPDTAFYNSVLRQQIRTGRFHLIKSTLARMQINKIAFNFPTYCLVASSTDKGTFGIQLIKDAEMAKMDLNTEFFNHLLHGCLYKTTKQFENNGVIIHHYEYWYLRKILQEISDRKIQPNVEMLQHFEKAVQVPKEYNRWDKVNIEFERELFKLKGAYKKWLESGIMAKSEEGNFNEFPKFEKQSYIKF